MCSHVLLCQRYRFREQSCISVLAVYVSFALMYSCARGISFMCSHVSVCQRYMFREQSCNSVLELYVS